MAVQLFLSEDYGDSVPEPEHGYDVWISDFPDRSDAFDPLGGDAASVLPGNGAEAVETGRGTH